MCGEVAYIYVLAVSLTPAYMTLKNKGLIITTIIFFLLVNTTYYWEGKLGLFAFPVFILLAGVFVGLVISFIRQIYFLIKERFSDKQRFYIRTTIEL